MIEEIVSAVTSAAMSVCTAISICESTPEPAVLKAEIDVHDYIIDISAGTGVAAVTDNLLGMSLVNTTRPASPGVYASFPGLYLSVLVHGSVAYAVEFRYVPGGPDEIRLVTFRFQAGGASIVSDILLEGQHSALHDALAVEGNLLHVATTHERMQTFDITNPLAPALLSTAPVLGWPKGAAASAGRAYVAAAGSFTIFDTSDPAAPTVEFTIDPADMLLTIEEDGRLYFASNGGLLISVDADMMDDTWVDSELRVADVAAAPGLLVGSWPDQVRVFDLTTPISPALVQSIPVPDLVQAIDIDGGLMVTGDAEGRFRVYTVPEPRGALLIGTTVLLLMGRWSRSRPTPAA